MSVADLVTGFLGSDLPVRFEGYDGSAAGPIDAPARIVLKSKDALRRIATRPGELGFARAYVAGDLEVEGDIFAVLSLRDRLPAVKLSGSQIAKLLSVAGPLALRPLSPPPEEVHLRGARHSKERDAAAIRHHYDVGNHFYEMVLGPSLTYSCAVFTSPAESLESAQAN
ncbi:MAG: class I SAM-dependent methyltransferase, partial [Acidimicrobiales bacterium]